MSDRNRIEPTFNDDFELNIASSDVPFNEHAGDLKSHSLVLDKNMVNKPIAIWLPVLSFLVALVLYFLTKTVGFNLEKLPSYLDAAIKMPYAFFMEYVVGPAAILLILPILVVLVSLPFSWGRSRNFRRWSFLLWSLVCSLAMAVTIITNGTGLNKSLKLNQQSDRELQDLLNTPNTKTSTLDQDELRIVNEQSLLVIPLHISDIEARVTVR